MVLMFVALMALLGWGAWLAAAHHWQEDFGLSIRCDMFGHDLSYRHPGSGRIYYSRKCLRCGWDSGLEFSQMREGQGG